VLSNVGYSIVIIIVAVILIVTIYAYEMGFLTGKSIIAKNVTKTYGKSMENIYSESSGYNLSMVAPRGYLSEIQSLGKCPAQINRGMIYIAYPSRLPCYTDFVRVGRGKDGDKTYDVYYNVMLFSDHLIITFTTKIQAHKTVVYFTNNTYEFKKYGLINIQDLVSDVRNVIIGKVTVKLDVSTTTFAYDVIVRRDNDGLIVYVGVCPPQFMYVCTQNENILIRRWG